MRPRRLLEIDGKRLDSNKGGDRSFRMEPGQIIEWKVRPEDETFTVEAIVFHPSLLRFEERDNNTNGPQSRSGILLASTNSG